MSTPGPKKTASGADAQQKDARVELRSSQAQKAIIETAAALLGESVTSYVLSTVVGDAQQVIRDHQATELTLNDWTRFNDILSNETAPNAALQEALTQYQERVNISDRA
jgi:uncharacterized protein (DUF1778 family)